MFLSSKANKHCKPKVQQSLAFGTLKVCFWQKRYPLRAPDRLCWVIIEISISNFKFRPFSRLKLISSFEANWRNFRNISISNFDLFIDRKFDFKIVISTQHYHSGHFDPLCTYNPFELFAIKKLKYFRYENGTSACL